MMIGSSDETVRVDLHLHSRASGSATNVWVKGLGDDGDVRESYTLPEESYRMAKRAGMDFVTLTDHETIYGSLTLLHHPDFLVGEEVSARFPEDGGYANILLYGLDAGSHVEAQDRRSNIYDLVEYLREAGIVHVLVHPMYSVTKQAKSREPSRCGLSPRWVCRSMTGSISAFHRSSMFWITSPKKSTTHCTWPPLARSGLQPSSLVFSLESRWSALTILISVPTPALSGDAFAAEIVEVAVREFYERCSVVAVPSQVTALAVRNRGYRIQAFEILRNDVDADLFTPRNREPDPREFLGVNKTLLLYVGRVSKAKGLE